jgi:DUF4097 and DUF4098 domain-containing protein YvlB
MKEERSKILEMVENGTITAQEAVMLLEALEKPVKEPVHEPVKESVEKDWFRDFADTMEKETKFYKEKVFGSAFKDRVAGAGTKDKIMDFMNMAVQKMKDFDFDFQFGQSVEFTHEFEEQTSVRHIDVDVANGRVEIVQWDHDHVKIECKAKVYRTDDSLEAKNIFLKNAVFSVENGVLRFKTEPKWMKCDTTVYVPKQEFEKIILRSFNGKVEGANLIVADLKAKTANGKIKFDYIKAERSELETANGSIKLHEFSGDKLEAQTMNGSVQMDGNMKFIDLQSLNGSVICRVTGKDTDTVQLKTLTGSVHAFVPGNSGLEGEAKTNLGSFKLLLDGMNTIDQKLDMVQKHVRFSREGNYDQNLHFYAETKTGSITIEKHDGVNIDTHKTSLDLEKKEEPVSLEKDLNE